MWDRLSCCPGAERLVGALAMRPLRAHCHLGLGRLYLRTSRPELGAGEVAEAIRLYRDMGMTFWLGQASARLQRAE